MKKTITFVLCFVLFVSSCGLVACDGEHEHNYATEWTKNATEHWHACTVEGCAEASDKAVHSWNSGSENGDKLIYTCTVCGEVKIESAAPSKKTTVSAAEWLTALDESNFKSFKAVGNVSEHGVTDTLTLIIESEDKGYLSGPSGQEHYSWLENGVYRNYTNQTGEWRYSVGTGFSIEAYESLLSVFSALRGAAYSDFQYSEDTKLYTGTLTFMNEEAEFTVGFTDGKLTSCSFVGETVGMDVNLSSYGTAAVKLPEMPTVTYSYPSFLEFVTPADISTLSIRQSNIDNEALSAFCSYYKYEVDATLLTSGTVQLFDVVNIDYIGYLEGESAPFEGGSALSYDLEIGSDNFIDGFEAGLIGAEIGDTVILDLTFPDDYRTSYFAGKAVRFYVTVNSLTRYDYPEITDAAVKNMGMGYETVAELKADVKTGLMWESLYNGSTFHKLPSDEVNAYYVPMLDYYVEYAAVYGMSFEQFVQAVGFSSIYEFSSNITMQCEAQVKNDVLILSSVEAYSLTLDGDAMDDAILEYYNDAVAGGQYSGSYNDFLSEYSRATIELEVYYVILTEYLTQSVSVV